MSIWDTAKLLKLLDKRLDMDNARDAAFALHVDWDNLPGDRKSAKLRELIRFLEQRQRLDDLIEWLRDNRPDIDLSSIMAATAPQPGPHRATSKVVFDATPRSRPTLLFDESRGQGLWSGGAPTLERDYALFQRQARAWGYTITSLAMGETLTDDTLRDVGAVVIAQPPSTGPGRSRNEALYLKPADIELLQAFVRAGRGLLILGTYGGGGHHWNINRPGTLNELLLPYDLGLSDDVILPTTAQFAVEHYRAIIDLEPAIAPGQPMAESQARLLAGVHRIQARSTCSIALQPGSSLATSILQTVGQAACFESDTPGVTPTIGLYQKRTHRTASLVAAWHGAGKVVISGCWRMFAAEALTPSPTGATYDNRKLLHNILDWLTDTDTPF